MYPIGLPKKHMETHVLRTLAMNTHKKESGHGRVVGLPFNKVRHIARAWGWLTSDLRKQGWRVLSQTAVDRLLVADGCFILFEPPIFRYPPFLITPLFIFCVLFVSPL